MFHWGNKKKKTVQSSPLGITEKDLEKNPIPTFAKTQDIKANSFPQNARVLPADKTVCRNVFWRQAFAGRHVEARLPRILKI
jgi:hypothetical protein